MVILHLYFEEVSLQKIGILQYYIRCSNIITILYRLIILQIYHLPSYHLRRQQYLPNLQINISPLLLKL